MNLFLDATEGTSAVTRQKVVGVVATCLSQNPWECIDAHSDVTLTRTRAPRRQK